jgi:hypothetical protein
MNPIYAIALILICLATALPLMCLVKMHMVKKFKEKAIATTAVIIRVEKRHGTRSAYYLIQLRYKTIDTGIEYTGQTIFANKNKVNEIIPVWYKAGDPAIFKTDSGKWLRWMLALSLLFFGLICWFSVWLLSREYTYRPN